MTRRHLLCTMSTLAAQTMLAQKRPLDIADYEPQSKLHVNETQVARVLIFDAGQT